MPDITRASGLPRQTYAESIFFDDSMLAETGVIKGHQRFGKRYLAAENLMAHLDEVIEAVKQDFLVNRNTKAICKIQMNPQMVFQCKTVWNKNTFIGIFRDKRHPEKIIYRKFYYSEDEIRKDIQNGIRPNEIEKNPALKNMKPRRPPTTNPLWCEIRESVPFRYAWEGYNVRDLALLGGFVYKFATGIRPRFTRQEELSDPRYKTRFVSHNYFEIKLQLLFSKWQPAANVIYINWKRMIMDTKVRGKLQDGNDNYQEDSDLE